MENDETGDQDFILVPVPKDQVPLVSTMLTAMDEGNRMVLDKVKRDVTTITNNRRYIKNLDDPDYSPVDYMSKDEVDTAYKHALDAENPSPDDCFNKVVVEHGVTKEYVDKAKDKPTYYSKAVVEENMGHSVVVKMKRNKVLDVKSLKKSSTPNQLINNITTRRSVSDRLDALESKVDELESEVREVKLKQLDTNMDIESIFSMVDKEPTDHKARQKEKAKMLKQLNYTYKEIAQTLGVDLRTVKRWLSSLRSVQK